MYEDIPRQVRIMTHQDNIAVDALLTRALNLLDEVGRYDVSAHVDLALHILRQKPIEPKESLGDMS